MSQEKESKKSALKWVLIGVIILSGIMLLYVTFPNDIRAARQLQSRGFEIESINMPLYQNLWVESGSGSFPSA